MLCRLYVYFYRFFRALRTMYKIRWIYDEVEWAFYLLVDYSEEKKTKILSMNIVIAFIIYYKTFPRTKLGALFYVIFTEYEKSILRHLLYIMSYRYFIK